MGNKTMQHNWASGTLKEVPFWRKDMQPEEYDYERSYFQQNWENFTNGKYKPLWRQADQSDNYRMVLASFKHEMKIAIYIKINGSTIVDDLKTIKINDTIYNVLDYNTISFVEYWNNKVLMMTLDTDKLVKLNQLVVFVDYKFSSTNDLARILSGEKVICSICGKGYIEPMVKDVSISIDKVSHFKCSNCGELLHIKRKISF